MSENSDQRVHLDEEEYLPEEVGLVYGDDFYSLSDLSFELRNPEGLEEIESEDERLQDLIPDYREGGDYVAADRPTLFIYGMDPGIGIPHMVLRDLSVIERRLEPRSEK